MKSAIPAATKPDRMFLLALLRSIEPESNQAAMILSAAIAPKRRNR